MFKILVAEDDGGAARLMLDTLADAGYETLLARDGLQALELVSQRHVDLLVLDLMLPRLDGFAALTQLRRAGSALPVLVLSAREAQADKRRALRLGADDYPGASTSAAAPKAKKKTPSSRSRSATKALASPSRRWGIFLISFIRPTPPAPPKAAAWACRWCAASSTCAAGASRSKAPPAAAARLASPCRRAGQTERRHKGAQSHGRVMMERMVRSVSRMPSLARMPMLRMVLSTPLVTMPSPPLNSRRCLYIW